jgi:hypothetical protein
LKTLLHCVVVRGGLGRGQSSFSPATGVGATSKYLIQKHQKAPELLLISWFSTCNTFLLRKKILSSSLADSPPMMGTLKILICIKKISRAYALFAHFLLPLHIRDCHWLAPHRLFQSLMFRVFFLFFAHINSQKT